MLQNYYRVKDLECGYKNHYLGIFNALYVNDIKLSYEDISAKFFVDIKCLYKVRKDMNLLAQKVENTKLKQSK